MEHFTPWSSLAGGLLIGLAATAMLGLLGRVAGISGIVGGLLAVEHDGAGWRGAFVAGLVAGGALLAAAAPARFAMGLDRSTGALVAAGVLVGFGSRMGSGCTSGHGVCGMARGSRRSIAATMTFMATGAIAAFMVSRLAGGRL